MYITSKNWKTQKDEEFKKLWSTKDLKNMLQFIKRTINFN